MTDSSQPMKESALKWQEKYDFILSVLEQTDSPTEDYFKAAHMLVDMKNAALAVEGEQVPVGWKLAPIEPTEEMIVAGDEKIIEVLQDNTFALREPTVAHLAYRAMLSSAPASPVTKGEDEKLYTQAEFDECGKIGESDGYEKAMQEIDMLTGGDGEYRYCIGGDPERHCPDDEAMKTRIIDRFAALSEPPASPVREREKIVEECAKVANEVRYAAELLRDGFPETDKDHLRWKYHEYGAREVLDKLRALKDSHHD